MFGGGEDGRSGSNRWGFLVVPSLVVSLLLTLVLMLVGFLIAVPVVFGLGLALFFAPRRRRRDAPRREGRDVVLDRDDYSFLD